MIVEYIKCGLKATWHTQESFGSVISSEARIEGSQTAVQLSFNTNVF